MTDSGKFEFVAGLAIALVTTVPQVNLWFERGGEGIGLTPLWIR
jgi:hypothetical protein